MLKESKHLKQYVAIFEVLVCHDGMILNSDVFHVAKVVTATDWVDAQMKARDQYPKEWDFKCISEKGNYDRWARLFGRIFERKVDQTTLRSLCTEHYANFIARYTEPHRFYHTINHIMDCLDELEQFKQAVIDPDAIELALWYHDAIYDAKEEDNEEMSVRLFLIEFVARYLPGLIDKKFAQQVRRLILATKQDKVPTEIDDQLINDIDLSIFGQSETKFDEYERQIRKEHEWLPDEVYATKRSAIIKSFLERLTIYSTDFFRDKYEAQAQQNLKRSLAHLHSR